MKLTSLFACAPLLATHAVAQEQDHPEAKRAELIKQYDANGDGELDDAEREELRKQLRERRRQTQRAEAASAASAPPGLGVRGTTMDAWTSANSPTSATTSCSRSWSFSRSGS